MEVSPKVAGSVLAIRADHETWGQALHDVEVTLESLGTMRCRMVEKQYEVCRFMANLPANRVAECEAKLAEIDASVA